MAASIFFIFAYAVFVLALVILSIFTFPIIFSKNFSGFSAILEAVRYGRAHLRHVFSFIGVGILLVFAFYALLLVAMLPMLGFGALQESSGSLAATAAYLLVILIYYAVFYLLLPLVLTVLLLLYLFNSYIDKNPVKNWK